MRMPMLTILAFGLLLCAGCARGGISLQDETPVYTVSCDNSPDDCHAGARTLCGGPYEMEDGSPPSADTGRTLSGFGWVDVSGRQQDSGSGGGRYSIRIRCK